MFNFSNDFIVRCDTCAVTGAIYEHFCNFTDEVSVQNACFIREILYDLYNTPPGFILQRSELLDILPFLCTE